MVTFYKSMALFWTLAEGLIVFFLRWGFLSYSRGEGRQRGFLIFSLILFALFCGLLFLGENLFGRILDLQQGHHLRIYRWALWNFFCTLWVVLEGLIMIYMIRIYRELRPSPARSRAFKPGNNSVRNRTMFGVPVLVFSLFTFYLFYQFNLLALVGSHDLDPKGIYRISVFYIRICGLFWILFEGVAALLTLKAYVTLKSMGSPNR